MDPRIPQWRDKLDQWIQDKKISGYALLSHRGRVESSRGDPLLFKGTSYPIVTDLFHRQERPTHIDIEGHHRMYTVLSAEGVFVAVSRGRRQGISIHYLDQNLIVVVSFLGSIQHRSIPLVTSLFDGN